MDKSRRSINSDNKNTTVTIKNPSANTKSSSSVTIQNTIDTDVFIGAYDHFFKTDKDLIHVKNNIGKAPHSVTIIPTTDYDFKLEKLKETKKARWVVSRYDEAWFGKDNFTDDGQINAEFLKTVKQNTEKIKSYYKPKRQLIMIPENSSNLFQAALAYYAIGQGVLLAYETKPAQKQISELDSKLRVEVYCKRVRKFLIENHPTSSAIDTIISPKKMIDLDDI